MYQAQFSINKVTLQKTNIFGLCNYIKSRTTSINQSTNSSNSTYSSNANNDCYVVCKICLKLGGQNIEPVCQYSKDNILSYMDNNVNIFETLAILQNLTHSLTKMDNFELTIGYYEKNFDYWFQPIKQSIIYSYQPLNIEARTFFGYTGERKSIIINMTIFFKCAPNFYGSYCQTYCFIDKNTTTTQNNNQSHFQCDNMGYINCMKGFQGIKCDQKICDRKCMNGYCENDQCICDQGWTGDMCNRCLKHPSCINGYCTNNSNCNCLPGWQGADCDKNACSEKPCQNNGVCQVIENVNDFKCICPLGYGGYLCQQVTDACATNKCLNGGKCLKISKDDFICKCPQRYTGRYCQQKQDFCEYTNCGPYGSCVQEYIESANKMTSYCSCQNGWKGVNCDQMVDFCETLPCKNSKSCIPTINNYFCDCLPGFKGKNCEERIKFFEITLFSPIRYRKLHWSVPKWRQMCQLEQFIPLRMSQWFYWRILSKSI